MTEIVPLDAIAARDLLDAIKVNLEDVATLAQGLWVGRGWTALGYKTWDELVKAEIRTVMPNFTRVERKEKVAELTAAGMSTRAVGAVLGVDEKTVRRDLDDPGAAIAAPARQVTGTDGKTYTVKPGIGEPGGNTGAPRPLNWDDEEDGEWGYIPTALDRKNAQALVGEITEQIKAPLRPMIADGLIAGFSRIARELDKIVTQVTISKAQHTELLAAYEQLGMILGLVVVQEE